MDGHGQLYEFWGRHLIATYGECDEAALRDHASLLRVLETTARASGATVLQTVSKSFSSSGLTAVLLLSESHASIHTYPEHRSCFVDLFTCGSHCHPERFGKLLTDYLRPGIAHQQIILRHLGDGEMLRMRETELAPTHAY